MAKDLKILSVVSGLYDGGHALWLKEHFEWRCIQADSALAWMVGKTPEKSLGNLHQAKSDFVWYPGTKALIRYHFPPPPQHRNPLKKHKLKRRGPIIFYGLNTCKG